MASEFGTDVVIVLTLILLEAVLSFDNAAILAAMVRKLPYKDRRKALLYGLVGAYALRIGAILLAAWLIRTPELKIIGGGYLIFLAIKHFWQLARHRAGAGHELQGSGGFLARWGIPVLVATIIQIEIIDLAFAVDQVIVAVAFTDKLVLIIIASMLGILFLRLAAALLSRVMDWLPLLEHMAYVAVGYVGIKLILLHPFFVTGAAVDAAGDWVAGTGTCSVPLPFLDIQHDTAQGALPGCEIPTPISVAVTMSLFLGPVVVKLLFGIPRGSASQHIVASDTTPPPAPSVAHLQVAAEEAHSGAVVDSRGWGLLKRRRKPPPGP